MREKLYGCSVTDVHTSILWVYQFSYDKGFLFGREKLNDFCNYKGVVFTAWVSEEEENDVFAMF